MLLLIVILLGAAVLWLLSSIFFERIGSIIIRIWNNFRK